MNVTELTQYYANTLPREYVTQPKAYATIEMLAYVGVLPQDGGVVYDVDGSVVTDVDGSPVTVLDPNAWPILPSAIIPAFDITTAVGQQLQFLAQAVGITNSGFDISGQWITLNDDDFRTLLMATSSRNYLRATTKAIVDFIFNFFSPGLQVRDDLFMHMTYYYGTPIGTDLVTELFIKSGLLPRPLGVGMDIIVFGYDYFGFLEDPDADTFGDLADPSVGGFFPMILA